MGKKTKDKRSQELAIERRIAEMAKSKTVDRGKLVLAVTLLWLVGLVLIVVKYGKIW